MVRQRNPHVVEALSATCDILSDEDAFLTQLAGNALRNLERRRGEGMLALDAAKLAATEVAVARRVVRQAVLSVCPECRLESRHVASILALVAAGAGSVTIPMGVDVRVEYGMLFLRARTNAGQPQAGWLEVPGELVLSDDGSSIVARLVQMPAGMDPERRAREHAKARGSYSVLLDAEAGPQQGDVICPLGMHGQSKKRSDLLNEARVPVAERPRVPVVRTSPTGSIVWAAGIRADERARCLPSSSVLLELEVRGPMAGPHERR